MTLSTSPALDRAQFGRDWEDWHRAHEQQRADRHGFLAVTGLHWLTTSPERIEHVPGEWTTGEGGPVVELAPGETLLVDGETVTGRHEFGVLAERGGVVVHAGEVAVEIAKRGGHDIVRPRHPEHFYLRTYDGTPTYVPNPRWRASARFEAYDQPRPTEVGAAVDGLTHVYDAPGELVFTLTGEEFRLVAFPGKGDDLLVLFTDATSGLTTYAANRAVSVPAPDADGTTVLDFNRAVNLPCAYTDFATCPLPPAGNRLPVGVEAGEKKPLARVTAEAVAV